MYEDDDFQEDYYEPEPPADDEDANGAGAGGDEPDVVAVGDPSAAANHGGRNGEAKGGAAPKDKRIPNDQRQTTPYMTKYEKARILGTRALQIRYVLVG